MEEREFFPPVVGGVSNVDLELWAKGSDGFGMELVEVGRLLVEDPEGLVRSVWSEGKVGDDRHLALLLSMLEMLSVVLPEGAIFKEKYIKEKRRAFVGACVEVAADDERIMEWVEVLGKLAGEERKMLTG